MENNERVITQSLQNTPPQTVGKNNYYFNNCSVTINEEGSAVKTLEQKVMNEAKQTEMMATIVSTITATVQKMTERRAEQENAKQPTTVRKRKKPTKVASAKKVAKPKKK